MQTKQKGIMYVYTHNACVFHTDNGHEKGETGFATCSLPCSMRASMRKKVCSITLKLRMNLVRLDNIMYIFMLNDCERVPLLYCITMSNYINSSSMLSNFGQMHTKNGEKDVGQTVAD